jgi:hypothetical protein
MQLWDHSLPKISSLGPIFYGTKWLLSRLPKQSPTFHSKFTTDKLLNKKGEAQYIIEGRSTRTGLLWLNPYELILSCILWHVNPLLGYATVKQGYGTSF